MSAIEEVLFADIGSSLGTRAFPVTISRDGKTMTGTGLTKRELFAAMAMQGYCARPQSMHLQGPNDIADEALATADALLERLAV